MPKHKHSHRTKSRSHARKVARDFDSDLRRGSLVALAVKSPDPAPAVDPLAKNQARWSVDVSRRTLHAALSLDCEHAAANAYCYASTKGVCRERYLRGRELIASEQGPLEPGELGPLAAAQRQAWRAASFRKEGHS